MTGIKRAILAVCILLSGCGLFPESEFTLSSTSRLPRWFQQPPGVSRSDLNVKALYYARYVSFVLRNDRTGRQLAKVKAEFVNKGNLVLPNSRRPNGVTPNYDILSANGIVEVIEFGTRDPVFEMVDDPDIRTQVLRMTGNEALLK